MHVRQNMPEDIPEIKPSGVDLHDFDDVNHWREEIYDKSRKALENSFPREYGNVRMEIGNLKTSRKPVGPEEEKQARMGNEKLFFPIKGTVVLKDRETGEELDRAENKTIMSVPHMTDRGTFVHNGSNYTSIRQARLLPGAYSRRKSNGQLEVHYNVKPGSGKPFRVLFDPESTEFRMDIGGSSLKLYSVMKALGVSDDDLRKAWGDEIYSANAETYDRKNINKLFSKLYPNEKSEISDSEKEQKIREAVEGNIVLKSTMNTTLGGMSDEA